MLFFLRLTAPLNNFVGHCLILMAVSIFKVIRYDLNMLLHHVYLTLSYILRIKEVKGLSLRSNDGFIWDKLILFGNFLWINMRLSQNSTNGNFTIFLIQAGKKYTLHKITNIREKVFFLRKYPHCTCIRLISKHFLGQNFHIYQFNTQYPKKKNVILM